MGCGIISSESLGCNMKLLGEFLIFCLTLEYSCKTGFPGCTVYVLVIKTECGWTLEGGIILHFSREAKKLIF